MHALIDFDIPKYSVGFACERNIYLRDGKEVTVKRGKEGMELHPWPEGEVEVFKGVRTIKDVVLDQKLLYGRLDVDPVANCLHSVKLTLQGIMKGAKATSFTGYVTKGECFRHDLLPVQRGPDGKLVLDASGKPIGYKANRLSDPKPALINDIQEYMIKQWDAVVCEGIEADDALGIAQCAAPPGQTIICTIDKDLDCIPGLHYNWNSYKIYEVTPDQALRHFWCQVMAGDNVDNIIGLKGVGMPTAIKRLKDIETKDLKQAVLQAYLDADRTEQDFNLNCKLIWILRKPLTEDYVK